MVAALARTGLIFFTTGLLEEAEGLAFGLDSGTTGECLDEVGDETSLEISPTLRLAFEGYNNNI